jgi:hypothetical protein
VKNHLGRREVGEDVSVECATARRPYVKAWLEGARLEFR